MQTPGMVNLPVPFTSLPASSALACLRCRLVPLLDHADPGNGELTSAFHLLAGEFCQGIQDLRYLRPFLLASRTHSIGNGTLWHCLHTLLHALH